MLKSCEYCKKEFNAKQNSIRFCSPTCVRVARFGKVINFTCPVCGKALQKRSKSKRDRKFCSRSCSASYNNRGIRRHGSSLEFRECRDRNCKNPVKSNASIFCSMSCSSKQRGYISIDLWEKSPEEVINVYSNLRRHILTKLGKVCSMCHVGEVYNNKPLTLELDHIDGNWKNNLPSNLRVVCPNCHSQTPTYKAKNKNKNAKDRDEAKYKRSRS